MLEVREEDIDKITEMFYRLLKGELPAPLALPCNCPDNEVRQVFEYANKFSSEYHAFAASVSAMSKGNLDISIPQGKMHILQSLKNLHANLRHLTWKTQQIAGGDLSQQVDFMGDFSKAFNSMTNQLHEAFAKIDSQNKDLSRANIRMKRDLDAAARIQRTLLPEHLPQIKGVNFAWSYRPCDELAGDSLNIVRINDNIVALYLMDVSGHGVPAALLSVTVTRNLHPTAGGAASLTAEAGTNPNAISPAVVASRLNTLYPMASNGDHYFTMIYGLLDIRTWQLRFTVAGHPAPILVRNGISQRLDICGYPIGMLPAAEYEESVIDLRPGDRLYFHSDGLTEEMDCNDEQFGDNRLFSGISEGLTSGLNENVRLLVDKVVAWHGEEHLTDDVSILALSID